ncbi:unnamed protein product [Arabidopsis thaliana]|uniref:(thale cress) hypothetical protein n=1 Tax=Arabidopsis thaliana TaxID=3702 RepID=A0A7G2ED92_ARATH|nr:unnamed protein product [Arabidopsis thaliana]
MRGKSIGVRVNGFLVYTRKKLKFRGHFARHDLSETKNNAGWYSTDAGVSETDTDK